MEPERSLLHSQAPATCSYPEPAQSSPCPHIPLPEDQNIILLSMPVPSKWPLSFRFPHQTLYMPLLFHKHATCPVHLIVFNLITQTILGEKYRPLSSILCRFLHSPVILSLLGPNILNTLLSNTLNLHSSLNVSDQVSHSTKQKAKL
jgi:hypothetical protein